MKITSNGFDSDIEIEFKSWKFPGGEVGFQITSPYIDSFISISTRIKNSDDLMELLLATDAVRRMGAIYIELQLAYIPYARQDRVELTGDSLAIKVFADIINGQKYNKIKVLDPHSNVASALINNIEIQDNTKLVDWALEKYYTDQLGKLTKQYILVSPDQGSLKKIEKLAKHLQYDRDIIIGSKERDPFTGQILSTKIDAKKTYVGNAYFIVDDICDGGRTFIELAKVLREKGAVEVNLIVSHGIFSASFDRFEGLINNVYTTNSFADSSITGPQGLNKRVNVFVQNLY